MRQYPNIPIQKCYTGKADWWEVIEPVRVEHPLGAYVLPKGYTTDLVSAPPVVYPLIHPHGAGSNEAICHDYEHDHRYGAKQIGHRHARQLSNLMLAVRMCQTQQPLWKMWLMLIWVSALSWVTWYNCLPRLNRFLKNELCKPATSSVSAAPATPGSSPTRGY